MFMEAQGYKLWSNILAEDNESTIQMSKNCRDSCTSTSKHIAIKYFGVTDQIKNGNIKIVHCPTKQMIADFFTKPLQGASFHLFRNVIIGWAHISIVYSAYVVTKERVGNNKNEANGNKVNKTEENLVTTMQAVSKKKSYAEAVKMQNERVKEQRDSAYGFNEDKDIIKLK